MIQETEVRQTRRAHGGSPRSANELFCSVARAVHVPFPALPFFEADRDARVRQMAEERRKNAQEARRIDEERTDVPGRLMRLKRTGLFFCHLSGPGGWKSAHAADLWKKITREEKDSPVGFHDFDPFSQTFRGHRKTPERFIFQRSGEWD